VLVADIDRARVDALAERIGAEVIPPEEAIGIECDVYAPCAFGGTLNAETIPPLRCRIVAGSANNELAESGDAARLQEAGILYAPDYVINSGGVLYAWGTEALHWDRENVETRLAGIGETLAAIYLRSEAEGITTEAAAERLARARLG
jgi:glutamate dehydrogenase/leucine dehydrogenase